MPEYHAVCSFRSPPFPCLLKRTGFLRFYLLPSLLNPKMHFLLLLWLPYQYLERISLLSVSRPMTHFLLWDRKSPKLSAWNQSPFTVLSMKHNFVLLLLLLEVSQAIWSEGRRKRDRQDKNQRTLPFLVKRRREDNFCLSYPLCNQWSTTISTEAEILVSVVASQSKFLTSLNFDVGSKRILCQRQELWCLYPTLFWSFHPSFCFRLGSSWRSVFLHNSTLLRS